MSDFLEIKSNHIKTIVKTLKKTANPWLIILFGSYAKGRARIDSDIDIAFLTDLNINEYQSFCIAQELASSLGINCDCVNLKIVSTVFQVQVIAYGKVIYCGDETRRKYYFLRTFKEYALLNEERAPILEQIKERGTIYGG